MADRLPVSVPEQFTRQNNRSHTQELVPIVDDQKFAYGTAGFRQRAELLPFIAYRMGYLAGLRARHLNKAIGLMITASHNPLADNGVKIIDPMGEMLAADWEKFASEIVNVTDDQLPTAVRALEVHANDSPNARVLCGYDTRDSGPYLAVAARAGAALMNVEFDDYKVLTTPMLHYIVRVENDMTFGPPLELGYYTRFGDAFNDLYKITETPTTFDKHLHIDCANGVGAQKMRMLVRFLTEGAIEPHFHNEDKALLNFECGADFVKIEKRLPSTFEGVTSTARCASFDGDADRLIYFHPSGDGHSVAILDGDRIALLIAKYITEQISLANIFTKLSLGIVQTAYANGNSSKYIREVLNLHPVFVPTGVKHLHREAMKYDIGVYFEANGHGTVVFSDKFHQIVSNASKENIPLLRLKLISEVINEVVGDALADLLAVELILRHFGWSIEDWEKKLYTDAPNIQIKVPVPDRSIFKTTYEETTLLEPVGVQSRIDELVAKKGPGCRAFVRPSGTENIVRVYAEATTPEETKLLGEEVADMIRSL